MPSAVASTVINQPVDKVFSYVTQVENHLAWQAGIVAARVAPPGPIGLGSVYTYTSEVMGRKMDTSMQVSKFEANKTWAVSTTGTPNPVETVYTFEPAGDGTRLTVSMDLDKGFPAMAAATIQGQMQKSMEEQAARLKANLEK